jgi:small ligand-binding sensory domain FIST
MNDRLLKRASMAIIAAVAAALAVPLLTGCAANSVAAYQREHLADPIMAFQARAGQDARRVRAFEAREGSTGGIGGEGGGCACK